MHHLRWRKAIVISVMVQMLFLGGVGWMAAKYFVPKDTEQYLEIELVTEIERENTVKPAIKEQQQQPNKITPPGTFAAKPSAPSPKVVISADAMSIIGTDMPMGVESEAVGTGGGTAVIGGNGGSGNKGTTGGSSGAGNGPGRKQGGVIEPSILRKVKPIYPQSARNAGIEGTVIVKIQILTNGRPGKISIASTSGNEDLDNAAIVAVQQFQFVPAKDRDSGDFIVCYCNLPVKFDLDS